ncbi:aldose epimerase family protein [Oleiagrimonas sp. C23AA]|uniref:aldose epimerase family protein n=1 Tax=Oleiagrimonas sp. C23AA TaxID=2719047 RepID=UPI0014211B41|nr:aldose epimerase family protein [Oleiagrimonas sp. C23AA]NII12197.1 galactose mutarotase [Oleiagrimonas sp. C23AA]
MNRVAWMNLLGATALAVPALACATTATRSDFGMADGHKVEAVTLKNSHGVSVRVITYGARVQSLVTPDAKGHEADVVLGYNSMAGYLDQRQYFGATVGRFANRIDKGQFTLDGKHYQLTINDGPNSLHGGKKGFDMQVWKITKVTHGPTASVTMQYVSPDGDQGYPGTLTTTATYALDEHNRLTIDYRATTDKTTIVNISNHTYWNLGGEGSGTIMHDTLMIPANAITPVNATQIPTGKITAVAGTPFDFRHAKAIGKDIRDGHSKQLLMGRGYDINFVLSHKQAAKPRLVARVTDPHSGRVLSLYSAKPGLQFYSGNFLNGTTVGKSGHIYRQGDAFVMEPQIFPDTPNQPQFGSAVLKPGQTYSNHIVYQFSTTKAAH